MGVRYGGCGTSIVCVGGWVGGVWVDSADLPGMNLNFYLLSLTICHHSASIYLFACLFESFAIYTAIVVHCYKPTLSVVICSYIFNSPRAQLACFLVSPSLFTQTC